MQAFLILAHEDERALDRLISKLIDVGEVFVHIDKKSRLKIDPNLSGRIKLISEFDIQWGHWSIVQATEALADMAIKEGCTRLTLISGVHAPIVSKDRLMSLADETNDYVSATKVSIENVPKYFIDRYQRRYFFSPFRSNRLLIRIWHAVIRRIILLTQALDYSKVLAPMTPVVGSQFWSVTSQTYLSAKNLADSRPEIRRYFQAIFCPDEGYFQTLFSYVSKAHINRGTTYVKWADRGAPRPLEIEDVERESKAGEFFFARKVFSSDKELIKTLETIWKG